MKSGRMSRDTVFQEIKPGAGFETGDFVTETFGGYLPYNDPGAQYLTITRNMTSKAFVCTTRPSFYSSLKTNYSRKLLGKPVVPHLRISTGQVH